MAKEKKIDPEGNRDHTNQTQQTSTIPAGIVEHDVPQDQTTTLQRALAGEPSNDE